ncbi:hypothetical protein BASA50_005206 [Batrachochytrium salamandrivorans]|uniref:DUF659 domain-containing protein n=1 Tax=Batrachochytrium salamandrivorans TaxID=1357716 RepID=A0ABQ8FD11_9FUNG|nr:hypothetical protein BASA50_005206 [Batrachochytrium salamandrivorans]
MSSFHNSTADLPHPANLPHPAHHDGSQLLPCDDFHHIPGSNFDEDDIISVNPPDVNVVDAPVVRLKHGRPSSDIWVWFTNDTNSHHLKSTTCKHCNLLINHHKKNECTKLHLNKCNMFCKLINGMKNFNRPDWYVRNKKKCKTVSSSSNTPSSSHQASIKQYALSKLSVKQKQKFHKHMAMHYYATGTSFQRIENLHLKNAIKSLRPDDNFLPNRRQLSSTLLYKCHQEVVAKVDTRMKGSTCCLTTDGWSNINDDPVYIAEDIARIIQKYDSTDFAGVVTNNISTNRKAWTLLREMFPSCYFQGCCSHGIHLLVKDIFAATKTKKARNTEATYPIGYLFQEMLEFIVDCRDVFKMFHNHHVVKAQLQELQRTTESRVLVRQAPTRWGTIQQMCQRLLDSESHLHTTSSARDFIKGTAAQQAERQKVKDIIADDQFVVKLKKALAIMVPLDRLIVKYQSDKVPISEVMPDFHALPKEFRMLLDFHIITQNEFEYLSSVSHARFVFLYGTAHGLSYLLDPRLLGESLPSDIRNDLETPCSRHPSIM